MQPRTHRGPGTLSSADPLALLAITVVTLAAVSGTALWVAGELASRINRTPNDIGWGAGVATIIELITNGDGLTGLWPQVPTATLIAALAFTAIIVIAALIGLLALYMRFAGRNNDGFATGTALKAFTHRARATETNRLHPQWNPDTSNPRNTGIQLGEHQRNMQKSFLSNL